MVDAEKQSQVSHRFIVADFSAIEARVLSWLAGEQWRIDTFKNGGDIYCASASQMFKVPVEKHGVNGHLRQKGKISELACVAEGSLVLTDTGLVPIEKVTIDQRVWDGESWVVHEGVVYRGYKEVMTYDGLTATKDHLVWIEGESEPVQLGTAAARRAHLLQTGAGGTAVRLGKGHITGKKMEQGMESLLCSYPMHRLWFNSMAEPIKSAYRKIKWLSKLFSAETDTDVVGQTAYSCKTEVRESEGQGVSELWCKRNKVFVSKRNGSGTVPDREIRTAGQGDGDRSDRQQRQLRKGEYPLCDTREKQSKQTLYCIKSVLSKILAVCEKRSYQKAVSWTIAERNNTGRGNGGVRETQELAAYRGKVRVYDIRNAGRHHRFTVSGRLVHNCGYGGSVGALKSMGAVEMGVPEDELQGLINDWRNANPHIVQLWDKIGRAAMKTIKDKTTVSLGRLCFIYERGILFIRLPGGRRLSYVKPDIGTNRFGGDSITYMGISQAKKWERLETFGGKLTENIVQAIARDLLAAAMMNVTKSRP